VCLKILTFKIVNKVNNICDHLFISNSMKILLLIELKKTGVFGKKSFLKTNVDLLNY
jgi:hypothetical protein